LKSALLAAGLQPVKITTEEFYLADAYGDRYCGLSVYDRVALAIAKCRRIVLLTGDGRLRRAAAAEGVEVWGSIGILDRLFEQECVTIDEYAACLRSLLEENGALVRLPERELRLRLGRVGAAS
jgi:hypothetical protein